MEVTGEVKACHAGAQGHGFHCRIHTAAAGQVISVQFYCAATGNLIHRQIGHQCYSAFCPDLHLVKAGHRGSIAGSIHQHAFGNFAGSVTCQGCIAKLYLGRICTGQHHFHCAGNIAGGIVAGVDIGCYIFPEDHGYITGNIAAICRVDIIDRHILQVKDHIAGGGSGVSGADTLADGCTVNGNLCRTGGICLERACIDSIPFAAQDRQICVLHCSFVITAGDTEQAGNTACTHTSANGKRMAAGENVIQFAGRFATQFQVVQHGRSVECQLLISFTNGGRLEDQLYRTCLTLDGHRVCMGRQIHPLCRGDRIVIKQHDRSGCCCSGCA